jgi:prophage regulatory protein
MAYMQKIIRKPKTLEKTGLSRSRLYAEIQAGRFPKPVKLSARAVGWIESEVDAWIESKIAEREAA